MMGDILFQGQGWEILYFEGKGQNSWLSFLTMLWNIYIQ
jgi:hypothetical protein